MLSTKNNTSFPCPSPAPSRKYSAIVNPESATRARAGPLRYASRIRVASLRSQAQRSDRKGSTQHHGRRT